MIPAIPASASGPLRLLHVIGSASAASGGPSVAALNMQAALTARGHHCDLATTDDDGPDRRLPVAHGEWIAGESGRVRYFRRSSAAYTSSLGLAAWLRAGVQDYDLVHVHGVFTFAPVAGAACARRRAVPYVISPHGMLNRWGLEQRRPLAKRLSLTLVERRLLRGAAAVHFMSEAERDQAGLLGIPMRGTVVMLGMPIASAAARFLRTPAEAAPVVLFLSRLHPIKRLDLLIEAFARVAASRPQAELWIAGEGPEVVVDSSRQRAEALGISSRLRWLGYVQGEEKERLLAGARVLAMPSYSENFGVSAVEAMAAGVPVVVSAGVGISELVRQAGAGIVFDGSLDGLAAALATLLDDRELQSRMGACARVAVRDQLSLPAFGLRLEALYRQALADGSR